MILYNSPSSYYSMVARYALQEAGVLYENRRMDIHFGKEQLASWYIELNPHMTVPTFVDDDRILIDSRDILKFAADSAGEKWLDADLGRQQEIARIVGNFYAIPIENLTFAKAMIKFQPLRLIFPKVLEGVIQKLQAELKDSKFPKQVQEKIAINENRYIYFTQGDLREKLNVEQNRIKAFVSFLPIPDSFLLGEKISSADIVVCILLGRLKMVGEYSLVGSFPLLNNWFSRMEERSAFENADIWVKFHFWKLLFRR